MKKIFPLLAMLVLFSTTVASASGPSYPWDDQTTLQVDVSMNHYVPAVQEVIVLRYFDQSDSMESVAFETLQQNEKQKGAIGAKYPLILLIKNSEVRYPLRT